MKAAEILERLNSGDKIEKLSYTKYKRNKIVRGSFNQYKFKSDDCLISEKQFHAIPITIIVTYRDVSITVYGSFGIHGKVKTP